MAYVAVNGKKLKFYDSVLSKVSCTNTTSVNFVYKHCGDQVEVSPDDSGIPLFGPSFCPFKHIKSDSFDSLKENEFIPVACVGLLVSFDKKVLLTRRPAHMRAFPLIWVPPGGHVDPHENLERTVQREVLEETGIEMPLPITPIMAWESTYPVRLDVGLPRKHHLVLYFVGISHETSESLSKRVLLSEDEADGYMWMSKTTASKLFSQDFEQLCGHIYDPLTKQFTSKTYEINDFVDDNKKERISTGTRYALNTWSNVGST